MQCPTCSAEMSRLVQLLDQQAEVHTCGQCGTLGLDETSGCRFLVPAQAKHYAALREALAGLLDVAGGGPDFFDKCQAAHAALEATKE